MLNKRGFTLIELLVVVSIIAILSIIAIVVYLEMGKGARDARRKQDLRSLAAALEIYYQKNNSVYPGSLGSLFPTYIDIVPNDPINTGVWDYTYTPPVGGCYALMAILEKQSDPDRNSVKQYKNCDGTSFASPDAFVITSSD